jgi:hypothetical protein
VKLVFSGLLKPASLFGSARKLQDSGISFRSQALYPKDRSPDSHCLGSGWMVKRNISSLEGIKSCLSSRPTGNIWTEFFWRVLGGKKVVFTYTF